MGYDGSERYYERSVVDGRTAVSRALMRVALPHGGAFHLPPDSRTDDRLKGRYNDFHWLTKGLFYETMQL